ncbi:ribosomal protein L1p/L10e family-domain-containing protein [Mycena belliarum]|uniref:Ribosomal protein L1p/L10e family-domain-containing protein n=1 Tax=Mycena belliarum TaxID=1033014 RepID=A0AAD6U1H2_9AGAR|nr:ribosomal protein L1p/L10e family-domain-containing protein [Mycena belliae]
MPGDGLIDGHVSLKQCKLAVEALHAHAAKIEKKREGELLPGKEQTIWLNVTVKKIASAHKFKPVKVPIVHPLVDPRTSAICLITKDPQRQYKDLLTEHNIKFISRVVGIEKLKGKFKPYEARRMLLKENGMFLADERVIPLLPKLLGVKWFEAKKQPIPVCLTRKDLKGELERAISSTYMNQNQGTCTAIKISTVLENLQAALPVIIKSIKGEWDNVQSLLLKTSQSAGLPIWSCDLGASDGGRWGGLVAPADDETSSLDADDEMEVAQEKAARKGKKRAVVEEEAAEEPKKKAKGADGKAVSSKAGKPVSASASPSTKPAPDASDAPAKSKKRKASVAADAAPPTPQSAPATGSKDTAARKNKPSTVDAAKVTAADGEAATPKGKKKSKSRGDDAAETPAQPVVVEQKKPKTPKGTPSGPPRVPETEASPASKKKRSKDAPPGNNSTAPPATAISSDGGEGKKVKGTKGKTGAAEAAPPSVTKEELKQKRVGKAGEKKKEKVAGAKGKSGKSAKDGIIGKKAAQ